MENNINILICDDDPVAGDLLYEALMDKEGFSVQLVDNPTKALELIQEYPIDIVLSDLSMPEMDGIELLKRVKAIKNDIDFIIITGFGTIKNAVTAMKNGAIDFLLKPVDLTELDIILEKVVGYRKLVEENLQLKAKLNQHFHIENILIGVSSIINNMRSMIYKISTVDSPILIYGESGTGKEVVARCIHFNSERRKNNFVPVFCSAIPVNLFEAELFGYKKGSFTGAIRDKKGLLEFADHGTLFFDEVSEITLDMQVKLLRFLQEQEILPIGSNERIKVDVKIIAATNKDLKKLVADGNFREDLYFRLNVLPVNIPPLRERKEDIPILIQHFLKKYNKPGINYRFNADVIKAFQSYNWAGNIRELENAIESSIVLAEKELIEISDLPIHLEHLIKSSANEKKTEIVIDKILPLEEMERRYILEVLKNVSWKKTQASKMLEISRQTLDNKIQKYNLTLEGNKDIS